MINEVIYDGTPTKFRHGSKVTIIHGIYKGYKGEIIAHKINNIKKTEIINGKLVNTPSKEIIYKLTNEKVLELNNVWFPESTLKKEEKFLGIFIK